jgi:lipopolysaccharide/colanic/teichoic acid biosynthesis glycosyltransferase
MIEPNPIPGTGKPPGLELAGETVRGTTRRPSGFYLHAGKQLLDTLLAFFGLAFTFPLLIVCAAAIRLDSRGPIFFQQLRVGQYGKLFSVFKFRTMVNHASRNGSDITASGDPRITAIGKWLRKFKLDEIPQLLNVLKGEMSLVGPRPELPQYVATYNDKQKRVLELRPGCTGSAALAFIDEEKLLAAAPNKESFYTNVLLPRKLDLDLAYRDSISFVTDLKLILITAVRLFRVR